MALLILTRDYGLLGVEITGAGGYRSDTHLMRVFERTGLIEIDASRGDRH